MNIQTPDNSPDPLLMAVLDADATRDQQREFDARLAKDPELRARFEHHREIEASLRRLGDSRRLQVTLPLDRAAISRPPQAKPIRRIFVTSGAIAAGLLLAACVTAVFMLRGGAPACSPAVIYDHLVATGLQPVWVCGDNDEFAAYTYRLKGEPLIVAQRDPRTEYVGWSYAATEQCDLMKHMSLALMTRHEGQPVIVLMEQVEFDRELTMPENSPLHLYRSEIGKVVLYEISPLPTAVVSPQLGRLDTPPAP